MPKTTWTHEDYEERRRAWLALLGTWTDVELAHALHSFGTLALERRAENELDLMRIERFHPDNAELVDLKASLCADYGRRFELVKVLAAAVRLRKGGPTLVATLAGWCAAIELERAAPPAE
jgi:hypothetical protein